VGNAIRDACGADIDILPITPDKIFYALENIFKE
jgi:CO/xanthine dehydrogenase Mo-binding subunit